MSDVTKRLEYVCKACGWRKSILAVWADVRPKKCMNKKCNTSFIKQPDLLMSHYPDETAKAKAAAQVNSEAVVADEAVQEAKPQYEERSFKKNKWKG